MKISKIFSDYGEKFLEKLRKNYITNFKKKNVVIALGGGSFLNGKIKKEILNNHVSFWLHLSSEKIIKRLRGSTNRPLIKDISKNELINLIKKRSNFYSKALYKVNCDNLSKIEIVNKVINIYESNEVNN